MTPGRQRVFHAPRTHGTWTGRSVGPVLVVIGAMLVTVLTPHVVMAAEHPMPDASTAQTTSIEASVREAEIARADARASLMLRYRPMLLAQAKAHECALLQGEELHHFDLVMEMFRSYLRRERLLAEAESGDAAEQLDKVLASEPYSGCGPVARNIVDMGWREARQIIRTLLEIGIWSDNVAPGP